MQPDSVRAGCVAQRQPPAEPQGSLRLPPHLPASAPLPAEQRPGAGAVGPSRWGAAMNACHSMLARLHASELRCYEVKMNVNKLNYPLEQPTIALIRRWLCFRGLY